MRIDNYLVNAMVGLSAEKDTDRILEKILQDAMTITNCDGGTVYTRSGQFLYFRNMITLSKNFHRSFTSGDTTMPPVPFGRKHVCASVALDKKLVNIEDVYLSKDFDFHGAMEYDRLNDYRSQSMLVIPMVDTNDHVIGVLQLLNAKDKEGNTIPFDKYYEPLIYGLGSLVAVCMNNQRLSQAFYDLLHSFVKVMVGAIDMRTPYNANHTKSMVSYGKKFVAWLNAQDGDWKIAEDMIDPFLMSIWLHDIGKLITPLSVMEKATRLGEYESELMHKFTVAILMEKLRVLESNEGYSSSLCNLETLQNAKEFVLKINPPIFLTDELLEELYRLKNLTCLDEDGNEIPLLSDYEYGLLSIRKGTLTDGERQIMENHVSDTAKMLSNMKFSGKYSHVPDWASAHHEYIDGTGYPNHLEGDALPREVRLLTILDIYDALTADDRPYKKPLPKEKAFSILHAMVDEGKLDGYVLDLFEKSEAWVK